MKIIQKICTTCNSTKPSTLDFFYKEKRTKDGLCSECKVCKSNYGKKYRATNQDKISQRERDRKHLPGRHYSKAKREAKTRNLIWDISRENFEKLLFTPCHYCFDKLDSKQKYTVGSGLDRIDNTIGYTLNNVLPCCKVCNQIRSNTLTVSETEELIKRLLEIRKL